MKKILPDIPKKVKEDIKLTTVSTVDSVLKIALTKELKPIEWVEVETLSKSGEGEKLPTTHTLKVFRSKLRIKTIVYLTINFNYFTLIFVYCISTH